MAGLGQVRWAAACGATQDGEGSPRRRAGSEEREDLHVAATGGAEQREDLIDACEEHGPRMRAWLGRGLPGWLLLSAGGAPSVSPRGASISGLPMATTAGRSRASGVGTSWYRFLWMRDGGTNAARRSRS